MNLQTVLEKQNISMYQLSKISGVPKTTIIDICSGKSKISDCRARTLFRLASALGCTMEYLIKFDFDSKGCENFDKKI